MASPASPSQGGGPPIETNPPATSKPPSPNADLYPDDVVTPTTGLSIGGALAAIFAIAVVVLLVLMVTGYNQSVPYLHPASAPSVTLAGDRDTVDSLMSNGTWVNVTESTLCSECPYSVTAGSQFTYTITLTNGFSPNGMEVQTLSANSPFQLVSWTPQHELIAAGLSQEISLTMVAPSSSGVYVIPLILIIDVS